MHNLFLGTSKYVFKLWDKKGIIGKKEMKLLEKRIEEMDVPTDIGRLPKKISSNYGSYTAEQWKNWTLIYSMFALKGLIPDKHLQGFQTFVLDYKYLCKATVLATDLQKAECATITRPWAMLIVSTYSLPYARNFGYYKQDHLSDEFCASVLIAASETKLPCSSSWPTYLKNVLSLTSLHSLILEWISSGHFM